LCSHFFCAAHPRFRSMRPPSCRFQKKCASRALMQISIRKIRSMKSRLSSLLNSTDADTATSGDRRAASGSSVARDWRARFASALPWLLLVGFVGVLAIVFGDRLIPARELSIGTVVTDRQSADAVSKSTHTQSESDAYEAPMLFQASGWVEPDPYPAMATALVDGVVESVEVLEGEK